jgi:hypothetical protein
MVSKKELVIAVLATFCLTVTIFMIMPIKSANNAYDPLLDYNHDGKIGLSDLVALATSYGTAGDPTITVEVTNTGTNWPVWSIYSAPFIVSSDIFDHPSPEGVGPGVYETCIFVHNPNETSSVPIMKKLVFVTLNESLPVIRWINQSYSLGPDSAFSVTSSEINQYKPTGYALSPMEGYVCIISPSPNLDVNAYYTVSQVMTSSSGSILNPPGNTTSIDSQIISPKPYGPVSFSNSTQISSVP